MLAVATALGLADPAWATDTMQPGFWVQTMLFCPNGPRATGNVADTVPVALAVVTLMAPRSQSPAPVWAPLLAHSVIPSCSLAGYFDPVMDTVWPLVRPVFGVIVIFGPATVVVVALAFVVVVVAALLLLQAANPTTIPRTTNVTCRLLFTFFLPSLVWTCRLC